MKTWPEAFWLQLQDIGQSPQYDIDQHRVTITKGVIMLFMWHTSSSGTYMSLFVRLHIEKKNLLIKAFVASITGCWPKSTMWCWPAQSGNNKSDNTFHVTYFSLGACLSLIQFSNSFDICSSQWKGDCTYLFHEYSYYYKFIFFIRLLGFW